MIKKEYQVPVVSVISFENEDIVTTSNSLSNPGSFNAGDNDIASSLLFGNGTNN